MVGSNLLLFWDYITQLKTRAMKKFRSPGSLLNQSFGFRVFLFMSLLSGWSKVSDFPTLGSLHFFLRKQTVSFFFCVLGFPGAPVKDVEMQEAHQHAQQNKPTSGSITGSGEECWEDFFFQEISCPGPFLNGPRKKPEYLLALASKLLNGVGWDSGPIHFFDGILEPRFLVDVFFLTFGITPVPYWFLAIYRGYDFHLQPVGTHFVGITWCFQSPQVYCRKVRATWPRRSCLNLHISEILWFTKKLY